MYKIRSTTVSTQAVPHQVEPIVCHHCGDVCPHDHPIEKELHFCCQGCHTVFVVLNENGLGQYYTFEVHPGISRRTIDQSKYEYLDEDDVISNLIEFKEGHKAKITFTLPQIHCASCIWLLENLHKLNPGISSSRVNFLKKTATVRFDIQLIRLRQVVELLASIGYTPELNLDNLSQKHNLPHNRRLMYKLGVAGFCFGNIMLLSFPDYLGLEDATANFAIGYINIILALPIVFYSGWDYLKAAYWSIKLRQLNIDIPIAIGMITLFVRSILEIYFSWGEGYLDSLAGFVFFLLIGKWFQDYTFQSISFDRNYKSYFPISAQVSIDEYKSKSVSLENLKEGDILLSKNEEIIPGDCILESDMAHIDYSFVTGESEPIVKKKGDVIYAGGKNKGRNIKLQLTKPIQHSYLTKLWDEDAFKIDKTANTQTTINQVGKFFTGIILIIALLTLLYWLNKDIPTAFNAFTAVLIVACPCALALAVPFTYGNVIRLLGKTKIYFKNVSTIERLQNISKVVFDKTGTITDYKSMQVQSMDTIPLEDKVYIKSAAFQSNHPMSTALYRLMDISEIAEVSSFEEILGQGTVTKINGHTILIGHSQFVLGKNDIEKGMLYCSIDRDKLYTFSVRHAYREGIDALLSMLSTSGYHLALLTGDTDKDSYTLKNMFPRESQMLFECSPKEKLTYIQTAQTTGYNVLMIGDGLNDSGALMQSDVGLVISDHTNNFTPACDIIVDASQFGLLKDLLLFIRRSKYILYGAFVMAFVYNVTGLYFAVQGLLSPVIAAILMPISSISVMLYGVIVSTYIFKKTL